MVEDRVELVCWKTVLKNSVANTVLKFLWGKHPVVFAVLLCASCGLIEARIL